MAYCAPLWLLNALCGTREDATTIRDEEVRSAQTSRIQLWIDVTRARPCSAGAIEFPPQPVEAFPAEVWLDQDGRIRGMGSTWPGTTGRLADKLFRRPAESYGKSSGNWVTTEFWDFGAEVTLPDLTSPDGGETTRPARLAGPPTTGAEGDPDPGPVETRDFRVFASRGERDELRREVLALCDALTLSADTHVRRGPLVGGLVFDVTGHRSDLDAFAERYGALLVARVDRLTAEQQPSDRYPTALEVSPLMRHDAPGTVVVTYRIDDGAQRSPPPRLQTRERRADPSAEAATCNQRLIECPWSRRARPLAWRPSAP
jgi:hypothetical protein